MSKVFDKNITKRKTKYKIVKKKSFLNLNKIGKIRKNK